MEIKQFTIEEDSAELRIDKVLTEEMPEHSRSFFQKLLKDGRVSVNGRIIKANYKASAEDIVEVILPDPVSRESFRRISRWMCFMRMTTSWW